MSDVSTADDSSSSEASTSTSTVAEKADDDTVDAVLSGSVTTPRTTAAVTFIGPSSAATADRQRCRQTVATDKDDVSQNVATSTEAMISPTTKVEFRSSLYRSV